MSILCDLREIKVKLEIDPNDPTEDKFLLFLGNDASKWIEELLDRGLVYKTRTEYYRGTGTTKLNLRARPVYPFPNGSQYSPITVYQDDSFSSYYGSVPGAFDSTTLLTYGVDYCLKIDDDQGVYSKSGILERINDCWARPLYRYGGLLAPYQDDDNGSIKVVYTAGYTPDTLPAPLRMAAAFLVARMRAILPLGMEIGSEGYEERSVSYIQERKNYLLSLIYPMIQPYLNRKW